MVGETFGDIKEAIFKAANAASNTDRQEEIVGEIRKQYWRACTMHPWHALRVGPTEYDFSSDDYSSGMLLPSDLFGVEMVWDDTHKVEFQDKLKSDTAPDEWGYRYYLYRPSRTALFRGTDCYLQNGGDTFTSESLTTDGSDMTGEYVRFHNIKGYYKITSATSPFGITPDYSGDDIYGKPFVVRPPETQRMVLIDPDEDELTDRTVNVYWWRAPMPLYNDDDEIILPFPKWLELLVLRETPSSRKNRPVSQGEIEEAYNECCRLNPSTKRVHGVRDKHGHRIDFSTNPFGQRQNSNALVNDIRRYGLNWRS
jgi:hypothetical protein